MGVLGLPQTIMTGGDLSATFRQGGVLGASHPGIFKEAVKDQLRAFASEEGANAAKQAVEDGSLYSLAKDSGLHIYDWGGGVQSGERVPGYTGLNASRVSRVAGNAPLIKQGERAYATMLNTQGYGVFEKYAQQMIDSGVRDPKLFQALAKTVNHPRGYGTGKIADIASATNVFFSGRNLVSRVQILLDPFIQPGSLLQPSARQLAAKNLISFAGANVALMGFLGLTGAAAGGAWSVNPNPLAGDFGMLRIGDTRIDTMAGMAPLLRVLVRGSAAIKNGEWDKVMPEITRFFANKAAPVPSLLRDIMVAQDPGLKRYLGQGGGSFSPKEFALRFAPMLLQDMLGAFEGAGGGVGGAALGAGTGAASLLGFGSNTYEDQQPKGNGSGGGWKFKRSGGGSNGGGWNFKR